jgi:hypothetical protein
MRKVWRFIKRWWWAFLAVIAAILGVVAAILVGGSKRSEGREPKPGETPKQTFRERAQEEVERVRLEGEIERARITATADAKREELDDIEAVGETDPAEARRQLASWLTSNL